MTQFCNFVHGLSSLVAILVVLAATASGVLALILGDQETASRSLLGLFVGVAFLGLTYAAYHSGRAVSVDEGKETR